MKNLSLGERVRLVSNSTGETLTIGILTRLSEPDEYPSCGIDGKSYDLTDEGDSYYIVAEPLRNTDQRAQDYIKRTEIYNPWIKDTPPNILESILYAYAEEVNRDVYQAGFQQGKYWAEREEYDRGFAAGLSEGINNYMS